MGKPHGIALVVLGILIAVVWLVLGRDDGPAPASAGRSAADQGTGVVGGPVAPAPPVGMATDAVIKDDVVFTPRDLRIFEETVEWARAEGLDTLDIGPMMARLGRRFVGADYTPHTLDPPGPERLVVNLREFDCVTYLENVLAIARVLRDGAPTFPAYTEELRRIRYRGGVLDGYASRLHYFSDWILDNAELGILRDITAEIGGVRVTEPVTWMSSNASSYRQLEGRPERSAAIREIERRLSARPRSYIPQERIAAIADRIQDGDVIAATSTVRGLDIAHTGLALWVDGRLHLMHAPLVGKSVEISTGPLAGRIQRIDGQNGIMVARPL
ncbi:MAG TPA: N-acetylmuramoyl-L-alanine amidase-like domain-containing protein [Longimicrobiales bacterium]|nr:N-acetylmuramoyl-L-alanine amidase-like domain-containing protein [Longimicrobiales bacterium]